MTLSWRTQSSSPLRPELSDFRQAASHSVTRVELRNDSLALVVAE